MKTAALALSMMLATWTTTVRADLLQDAGSLVAAYRKSGAAVERLPPQFLSAGESRRVSIQRTQPDAQPAGQPAGQPETQRRCTTLIAIAERPIHFELRPALPPGFGVHHEPTRSEAGYATIVDCGRGVLGVGAIELSMGARRGAVELIVGAHDKRLTAVELLLPERALGPVPPDTEITGSLDVAPLEDRVTRAEVAAMADGADRVVRVPSQSDERGVNALALRLRDGCHRISVLAEQVAGPAGPIPVDIDAEVRLPGAEVPLRQDRSHAPDARLDFCMGETTRVDLRFAGAGGRAEVMVLDAHWPIPPGIGDGWGARARAGHAWALHRRRAPRVVDPPMLSVVGAPGVTEVPFEVQPGACYLVSVATTEGEVFAGQLSAWLGAESRHDDMSEIPRAAALTFCAGPHDVLATLRVDIRAHAAWWLMHAWQVTEPEAR